ncbi:MAG: hypothetical protein CSA54_00740 [Gammaproteobacteria bacterium]|nr:MAG: hypothetical protein CSA54_00740 [Gammaproteobacteria bacterium]
MQIKHLCFILFITLPCLSQGAGKNALSKDKLDITYAAKDSLTKESHSYGLIWNIDIDHTPVNLLGSQHKFSIDVSAEVNESESSTEKIRINKHGIGLRVAAEETPYRIEPFVSLGIENIKETKTSPTETLRGKYDSSFKWGAGFTLPLLSHSASGLKRDPAIKLEVAYYRNYERFPFDNKVYAETKVSVLLDIFAWLIP